MWRKVLRGIGCAGYVGLLLGLFALVAYAAFSQFVRRGVTRTPELVGLDEKEARAMLADQGLRLEWSPEADRYDEAVAAGHVLLQRPRAGTLVKRGREVTVVFSRGPQLIEVPEVQGQALQAAQVSLAAAGLKLGRTLHVYSEGGAVGTVVEQHPAGGVRVERDAPVDLFLAVESSMDTYLMPDLVKHSYDEVRRFFEANGFRLGRVSYESYDGVAPGTVLRQFPLAGHPLRRGDVISLGVVRPADEAFGAAAPDAGAGEAAPAPAGAEEMPASDGEAVP